MNLSIRLQTIADFVPAGGTMADVGTDHGHLPIWLVQSGKIESAIAMDVREGPLSRAAQAVHSCGLEKQIQLRLADGLTALLPGEAQTVVIAGMGGALIRKILEEGRHMWDSVEHWILSPQSEQADFRHWLEMQGFCILKEEMICDAGKYYVVMDVMRGSMHYDEEYEYTYGKLLIDQKSKILQQYLEEELVKLRQLKQQLMPKAGNRTAESANREADAAPDISSDLRLMRRQQRITELEKAYEEAELTLRIVKNS